MSFETLTLKSIRARPVVLKLKRPVVARIATLADWPLILIDLYTEEGVIGRSYLELYISRSISKAAGSLRSNITKAEIPDGSRKRGHRVTRGGRFQGSEAASWPRASCR
jgi:hypothetical protein